MADTTAPTDLETYFLQLVNQERAKVGDAPLTMDDELVEAARDHSIWMDQTDTFSHTGANGSSPGQRMTDAGYGVNGSWGENIAYVTGPMDKATVDQLEKMFVASPEHYQNMIRTDVQEVGIGLHIGDINGKNVVFVTEDFASPNAAETAENAAATNTATSSPASESTSNGTTNAPPSAGSGNADAGKSASGGGSSGNASPGAPSGSTDHGAHTPHHHNSTSGHSPWSSASQTGAAGSDALAHNQTWNWSHQDQTVTEAAQGLEARSHVHLIAHDFVVL